MHAQPPGGVSLVPHCPHRTDGAPSAKADPMSFARPTTKSTEITGNFRRMVILSAARLNKPTRAAFPVQETRSGESDRARNYHFDQF